LALKQGSSTGVDCVDVKHVLSAFQEINKCRLIVRLTVDGTAARPDLVLAVKAEEIVIGDVVPALLASTSVIVGSMGPRTLEAAILQELYRLDAIIAEYEFAKEHNK
jgi:hypothetical protein